MKNLFIKSLVLNDNKNTENPIKHEACHVQGANGL